MMETCFSALPYVTFGIVGFFIGKAIIALIEWVVEGMSDDKPKEGRDNDADK